METVRRPRTELYEKLKQLDEWYLEFGGRPESMQPIVEGSGLDLLQSLEDHHCEVVFKLVRSQVKKVSNETSLEVLVGIMRAERDNARSG